MPGAGRTPLAGHWVSPALAGRRVNRGHPRRVSRWGSQQLRLEGQARPGPLRTARSCLPLRSLPRWPLAGRSSHFFPYRASRESHFGPHTAPAMGVKCQSNARSHRGADPLCGMRIPHPRRGRAQPDAMRGAGASRATPRVCGHGWNEVGARPEPARGNRRMPREWHRARPRVRDGGRQRSRPGNLQRALQVTAVRSAARGVTVRRRGRVPPRGVTVVVRARPVALGPA
jgi:hypothetical protein